MVAVVLEPISPEIVLVCPELRQQAIAALRDFGAEALAAQTRARAVPQAPETFAQEPAMLPLMLPLALVWFLCVTLATLAMTLLADAAR